ncbi:MAG TPA: SH3 domain-containing protein [Kofleriaceae bacterium]|jgi:hypothetical protein|nr:SH3 domain-containing protein [Kofleriaceae bacterium]
MKRVLLLLLLATGVAVAAPKVGSMVTIRVMSAKVMKSPKFIGPTAGSVSRGDSLTVKEVKGDWYRVEGSYSGWIHKSNVTEGKVALSSTPGGSGGNVNRDEVELAGRGFTPQVEQQYKDKNPNLDFSHVDAIEKVSIDPSELESFVTEGKLK